MALKLRLLKGDGKAARFMKLRLRGRGSDPKGKVDYKISIAARTDKEGRVLFTTLPELAYTLSMRGFSCQVFLDQGREKVIQLP